MLILLGCCLAEGCKHLLLLPLLCALQHVLLSPICTDLCPKKLQRAPCGLDNGSSNTSTTKEEQEERLLHIAQIADATIRAHVLNDMIAANTLKGLLQQHACLKDRSEE